MCVRGVGCGGVDKHLHQPPRYNIVVLLLMRNSNCNTILCVNVHKPHAMCIDKHSMTIRRYATY